MAQDYPSKLVKIIVPYPAGDVLDALVRSMAQLRLQAKLGQTFIVENVPGASGNIGRVACGRVPDGWPPSSRVRLRLPSTCWQCISAAWA